MEPARQPGGGGRRSGEAVSVAREALPSSAEGAEPDTHRNAEANDPREATTNVRALAQLPICELAAGSARKAAQLVREFIVTT